MDREKFKILSRQLGLETEDNLEKIIEFNKEENSPSNIDEELSSNFSVAEKSQETPLKNVTLNNEETSENGHEKKSENDEGEGELSFKDKFISMPVLSNEEDLLNDENFALPLNYSNKYNLERQDFEPVEINKALEICINKLGKVDVEYISSLSLLSLKDVVLKLRGKIFKDPSLKGQYFYQGYLTEDEYLSGNIMKKYREAKEAESKNKGMYTSNVIALSSIIPKRPRFEDIYFSLGAPFIPAHYIAEFVQYLYRMSVVKNKRICEVIYQKSVHRWAVILNIDARSTVLASKTYGTERMNMFKILEKALNHEQIRITDAEEDGGKGRKFNREETMLAEEKKVRLNDAFLRWLKELPQEEKDELTQIYYEKFCCFVPRNFKNCLVKIKDKINGIDLYDYQKSAVLRIISTPSTMLAHDVGAGKTYAMVASSHELKLRDKNSKTMIVVPNSILMQWEEDYRLLYPDADILVVTPSSFTPENRHLTLQKMKWNYEAILISYSTFEMIPAGTSWAISRLTEQIQQLDKEMEDSFVKRSIVRNKVNALILKGKEKLKKALHEKMKEKFDDLTFEDLNVTSLFIDEAHNYKNLPLDSSLGQIKGINSEGSKKCADIYLKMKITGQRENSHLVFATGTPVTNSVADVFVMQKYLAEDILTDCDIDYFDNWAGTFGEITCAYEIDVDTDSYRLANRFNKFNNLSELSSMINQFTDFHVEGKDGLPEVERVQTVVVKKSAIQVKLLSDISKRVDKIRAGTVDKKKDNLLKVTTDGRKIALDARLVKPDKDGRTGNKIPACALEVSKLYYKYPGKTQLVFCDIGTPKPGYNVYDELKERLIDNGIEENSIGFVHDATSEERRAKMFESVNKGVIRVLIGSTFKLGTGVNVQERLIAIHHLDVPWRPSDMVQREGRLVRRGNTNEKVFIYRYVTDGSFDAYSWQLLENKQRFITELLTGTASGADERKLDDAVLSYAEVKALAVGNPLVKTRVELVNELARVKTLLKEEKNKQNEVENLKLVLPGKIEEEKQKLQAVREDIKNSEKMPEIANKALIGRLISETIAESAMSGSEVFIYEVNGFKIYLPANFNKIRPYLVVVGKMRYTVNIVTFSIGAVTKIENFLHNLSKIEDKFKEEIEGLEMQFKEAVFDDSCCMEYQVEIDNLTAKLKEVDVQLGL